MRKRYLFGLLTLALCLMVVPGLRSQYPSPKVDGFLNSLSTFRDAEMARSAFQNLRFTEEERRLLEGGLRKPVYAAQVERLVKTIKGPASRLATAVKDISVLRQDDIRKIAETNQRLTAQTQSIMAASAKVAGTVVAVTGTLPKITSLSQQTIAPGQDLIIRGTDFLPQGSVTFTFGSSGFDGQVTEWTNDLIFVQLPTGIRGVQEMDGNVTVRKQGRMLRADAPIHFVPTWDYQVLRSDALTYASQPWDLVAALALFFFSGQTTWCAQFNISFPSVPSYKLLNTWAINGLYYDSDHRVDLQGESTLAYIGSTTLPNRTRGQLCHPINAAAEIYCVVTIKGPLGVPYK